MKKISKYYLKAQARDIPPDTIIYKEPPDARSRKRVVPYTITNKITFYSDDHEEIVQEAKKMLYLIGADGKISFIPPEYYVSVGFDTLDELKEFLTKMK